VAVHRSEQLGIARHAAIAALRLQEGLKPAANRFRVLTIIQVRVPVAQESQERESRHRRVCFGPCSAAIVTEDEPLLASAKTICIPMTAWGLRAR
jgi:hypothetical protein